MFTYTKEQLKAWKAKYGADKIFEVKSGDKKAVLHKPTRHDLSFATAGSSQGKDPVKFTEVLLKQCWIDGDREILEDDEHFLGVMPVLQALSEVKEAEIKKL
ncbi:MAG: hypothetical protein ACI3Y2_06835 [Candidatus Egerieousia sp.]